MYNAYERREVKLQGALGVGILELWDSQCNCGTYPFRMGGDLRPGPHCRDRAEARRGGEDLGMMLLRNYGMPPPFTSMTVDELTTQISARYGLAR